MRVLEGIAGRRPTALEEAYQVFRLERQGNLVAPRTLEFYDRRVGELIAWLRSEAPTVERVEDVGVNHLRAFRAFMTERRRPDGQPLAGRDSACVASRDSHVPRLGGARRLRRRRADAPAAAAAPAAQGGDGLPRDPAARHPDGLQAAGGDACGARAGRVRSAHQRAFWARCARPRRALRRDAQLAGTRTCRAARALGCRRQGSQGPARADHAATRARHQALRRSRSDEERPGRLAGQPARAGRMASGGSTR